MRRIVANQYQAAGGAVPLDTYFDRVIKYIPADVVGAWVAVTSLIAAATGVPTTSILWIMFGVMTVICFVWMVRQTGVPGRPPATTQAVLATGSFVVWVFALGGPFATLTWYHSLYGSLLLIVYTLVVAMVIPKEDTT